MKSCYTYLPLGVGIALTNFDENATSIVSVEESLPGTTEPDPPSSYSLTRKAQACQISLDRATEFHALADSDQRLKIQGLTN
ncbi:MAG: hypothetical protein HC772_18105 [Leptolyngbyaceae cyanobacterium CRU_2_3]|nr:hypothetical protein [Leptolyngbyaceae cyanobacterium CRU_2_3]